MTTPIDLANLWTSIYSNCSSVISGTAAGSRFFYGRAPELTDLPCVVVSIVDTIPDDTFDADGFVMRVQFSVYGTESAGPRAAMDIADALRAKHRQPTSGWTVTGHTLTSFRTDIERGPYRDGDAWRLDIDYIYSGFAA